MFVVSESKKKISVIFVPVDKKNNSIKLKTEQKDRKCYAVILSFAETVQF